MLPRDIINNSTIKTLCSSAGGTPARSNLVGRQAQDLVTLPRVMRVQMKCHIGGSSETPVAGVFH